MAILSMRLDDKHSFSRQPLSKWRQLHLFLFYVSQTVLRLADWTHYNIQSVWEHFHYFQGSRLSQTSTSLFIIIHMQCPPRTFNHLIQVGVLSVIQDGPFIVKRFKTGFCRVWRIHEFVPLHLPDRQHENRPKVWKRCHIRWNLHMKTTLGTNKMWCLYKGFIWRFNIMESIPWRTSKLWSL